MKKLEVGDYVINLTEKQFSKIMALQPKQFCKYGYSIGQTDRLIYEGFYIDFLAGAHGVELNNELTYRQFLLRAKNTFL